MFLIIHRLLSGTSAAALTLGLVACSSSYAPARSPHVAITQENGTVTYVRDGERYSHGFAGVGLQDAVRGNPRAEHEARLYSRELGWGFGTFMSGLGFMLTGLAILPNDNNHVVWNARAYTGLSLVGVGFAAYTTGFILVLSAQPHQWDAINIYNDEVDARLRAQFSAQLPNSAGYRGAPFSTLPAPAPTDSMLPPVSPTPAPSFETPSTTGNPAVGRFPAPQDTPISPARTAPASGK